jgi:hypothetical protein
MSPVRITRFGLIAVACAVIGHSASVTGQGIGKVTVTASPQRYTGSCPVEIRFTAKVAIEKTPMSANYRWTRSDGGTGSEKVATVTNAAARTLTLNDAWQVGAKGARLEVWQKIRVRSGTADVTSQSPTVLVVCR